VPMERLTALFTGSRLAAFTFIPSFFSASENRTLAPIGASFRKEMCDVRHIKE
jgi:hypothetical protein